MIVSVPIHPQSLKLNDEMIGEEEYQAIITWLDNGGPYPFYDPQEENHNV